MEEYIKDYFKDLCSSINKVSFQDIELVIKLLDSVYKNNGRIFLIGNGGSSAIASHFASDLNKTVLGHKGDKNVKRFQAFCLSDNVPVLTAWANDVGFEKIFAEQLKNFAKPNDVLIAISSSGNSPDIIEAIKVAKELSVQVISMVGFDGGEILPLANVKVHVSSSSYAMVESVHDAICHLITYYFEKNIN